MNTSTPSTAGYTDHIMSGPSFPVDVPMTEEEAALLYEAGDLRMQQVVRTPGQSAHSTHSGGQTYGRDKPVNGAENDAQLRFQ